MGRRAKPLRTIGAVLASARRRAQLNQTDAAALFGVTRQTWSAWENGWSLCGDIDDIVARLNDLSAPISGPA